MQEMKYIPQDYFFPLHYTKHHTTKGEIIISLDQFMF